MGEYEEKQKEVSKKYDEYRKEFYTPGSGTGDQKLEGKNRTMQQKTESVAEALRELQAVAPASEQAKIADAVARTENEAREFGERADHYKSKRNKG
jgi:hypothetical protein